MKQIHRKLATLIFGALLLAGQGAVWADPPSVAIASGPLFSGRGNVHPNMLLNLSVEFPTVGVAYPSGTYSGATAYVGYFNSDKCYTYPTTVSSTTASGTTAGSTTNNSSSTPNSTTTTTTTSGVVTTVVTTTDSVTTIPAVNSTPTYAASNKTIYNSSKLGATALYLSSNFDPITGNKGSIVGYLNGNTNSGNKTGNNTHITGATAPVPLQYGHTPTTTTAATTAIPYPDLTDATGYFSIFKAADTNRECGGDSFSGNFLNWASSSAIDMLRYAMTGGDRVIDEANRTVLQRAWLPDGTYNGNSNFYAQGTYFPRKSITSPTRVTPFTASTLYIISCRNRILFSNTNGGNDCSAARTSTTGSTTTLLTSDKYFGEYLARVSVCDATEGPTRSDLCQKYGSNYKPEGELQRNSDKIRVGALGYLTGHDTGNSNVYGGVIRGPVKYVGPKKFDAPSFAESANDKPEWDATTGVFYSNPQDPANNTSTTVNSGVVNYLNKFGRTNTARLGAYKTWDPVGELYYEALRYLQGQQPTKVGASDATNAISALGTDLTDDNFPVLQTVTDPVTASCQNNYILTIGDVNTHNDAYQPGAPAHSADIARTADGLIPGNTDALNVVTMTNKVGAMEADAAGAFGNSLRRTNLANLSTIYTTTGTGTMYMAGMAYWANVNNIRADKPVRVKTFAIDVDEGGNGSLEDSNPRGLKPRNSQFYLAAKYGGFNDKNKDGNPFKTYGIDGASLVNDNSEWATNGTDPDNYFLASDPTKMIGSIKRIFQVVASNSGTISGVTLTSTKVSTDSSFVYQPGFDSGKWGGSLLKLALNLVDLNAANVGQPGYVPNNVVKIQDSASPTWDAGIVLTGKTATTVPVAAAVPPNPAPADRAIYTATVAADKSLTTVPFAYASLSAAQQALLDTSPVSPFASDGLGARRVDYLRGSRTDEIGQPNGIFRQRDRVMGDIINSNPTYVGAPSASIQGSSYKTFYDSNVNRRKAVYVGANDGMLHAFDAADGHELFAYVPNALMAGLNQLTDSNYVHRPYVDGTLSVNEASVNGSWKTILASGMGGGAKGVFVLDVTDPANFSTGSGAIWEFTNKDDKDMGNLTSPPLVAKFMTTTGATPAYKYFVVVPGGYNNYKDDAGATTCDPASTTCDSTAPGAMFLLSLDKPAGDAWALGTNYYKFTTPIKVTTLQNGLSSPALVLGNDGAVKYAYAGDLQGNLWRFDFTLSGAPWSGARSSNTPLFTAQDSASPANRQPITQQPRVVYAPGGYVVLFGTGKYVENADAASGNYKTQSFYGIFDNLGSMASAAVTRSKLAARTVTAYSDSDNPDAVKITGASFDYGPNPGKSGWYMDFLNSSTNGERSVTNALVAYGNLYFNSLITGSDPCATGGGRTYGLDALSGLPLSSTGLAVSGGITGQISMVGMLNSPVLFETGTDVGARDSIGKRVAKKSYSVFNFGTGGISGTAAAAKNGTGSFQPPAGRNSWREIVNYQELRDAANP